MSKTICRMALALAVVAAPLGAQATLVTFDDLWGAAPSGTDTPVALGTIQGLTFTGATAYRRSMLGDEDGAIPKLRDPEVGGFALNREPRKLTGCGADQLSPCDPEPTTPITISLGANQFFTSIQFQFAASSGTSNIAFLRNGNESSAQLLTSGSVNMDWAESIKWTFALNEQINGIEFNPAGGVVLALDTMNFDIGRVGPDPTVPEPASYALVALALLAAGGASRRRKA